MVTSTSASTSPTIAESPPQHVLYQEHVVPQENLGPTIQATMGALYGRIEAEGVAPAGPPFVVYKSLKSPWELEICAPVATPMTPSAEFRYREVRAARVAALLHVGPYETLGDAYDDLQGFIRERGLETSGPPREIYLSEPETPPDRIETIVEWPIAV